MSGFFAGGLDLFVMRPYDVSGYIARCARASLPPQRVSTIYDIAEQVGVSTATVSRALNGDQCVSSDTKARIEHAATKLNYRPHVTAKSLALQKTDTLAVVIPVRANDFYVNVLRGMQDALDESETTFDLIIFAATNPDRADAQVQRASQRGRSEGLLLLSMTPTDAQTDHLLRAELPTVLVDAEHDEFASVAVDNVLGGYLATSHLLSQGYTRIAHITVPPVSSPAAERRRGYEKALHEAGQPVDPHWVVECGSPPYEYTEASGYDAMNALLRRSERPDAVFAVSDTLALGALKAANEAGVTVPSDIALIGFDDIRASQYVGLSTLRQPMREIGRRAVATLLARTSGTADDAAPASTVLEPRLIERATSQPSPSAPT